MVQDREHDRQQDPLLDADRRRPRAVSAATTNSSTRQPEDRPHARDVDELDADQEHDRREHRLRHVGERLREEQQHDQDDDGRRELRDLAPAAGAVDHLGLRGAPVHDERAATARPTRSPGRGRRGRRSRRTARCTSRRRRATWRRSERGRRGRSRPRWRAASPTRSSPTTGCRTFGSPLGTLPSVATPCGARSSA